MTPADSPRTLFGAIERDLRSVAYAGAMDVILATTKAGSPERIRACAEARKQHDMPREREAVELADYLGRHFGTPHPMWTRHEDERDLLVKDRIEDAERALYQGVTD